MAVLREALLVHYLKRMRSSRVGQHQTARFDNEEHPGLDGQLETHALDSMAPRVSFHVVGPTLHRKVQVEGAAATLRMQLQTLHFLSLPG